MLRRVGFGRHAAVAVAALVAPVLALLGVLGGGRHEERFDAKQVVIAPAGGDAVRIREVVDIDFGDEARRGYQRIIPNDFGVPTDVEASSPDAPDDLSVVPTVDEFGVPSTQIRIGNPDITNTGQHRYVLSYTLPEAQLSTGELALDVIGNNEILETGRFEVVLTGFDLDDPLCNVGSFGTEGGCTLEAGDDGTLVTVIEPLDAGEGITVGGTIVALTTPVAVAEPALPDRRQDRRVLWAVVLGVLSIGTGVGAYIVARRTGRNQVAVGGAVDAAFPPPGSPVELVADDDLDRFVTTEFAPPTGLRPWEGQVLLTETIDSDTVSAWLSGLVAEDVIAISKDPAELSRGPRYSSASAADRAALDAVFEADDRIDLSGYRPEMRTLWDRQYIDLRDSVGRRGWWVSSPPGTTPSWPRALTVVLVLSAVVVGLGWLTGLLRSWPVALAVAIVVPGSVAYLAYRRLLPVRSAAGSGLAVRTESFRRFLEASEGRHVEWAWQHGLLREYSAWAVALGAATAWEHALEGSSVPPADRVQAAPLAVYWAAGALASSITAPASSSSGGSGFSGGGFSGGGFSGGSVGGGGGGGSSGSW